MAIVRKKARLLYLLDILRKKTDEDHPMSAAELIGKLAANGIAAERKTIYDDIALLGDLGYDIVHSKGKKAGYFLGERRFEFPELKMFADAVQSAKFITPKKTRELIKKIQALMSENQANALKQQLFLANRYKTQNEEIYYNIDKITRAIEKKKKVCFLYCEYTPDKKMRYRKNGALYHVSPYALSWFEDAYYLVGNMAKFDNLAHFRVDRVSKVGITGEPVRPVEEVSEFKNYLDPAEYQKELFHMIGGERLTVRIRFKNHLATTVFDKFGLSARVIETDGETFTVSVPVRASGGFLSWIMLFGKDAEILSPKRIREDILKLSEGIFGIYREKT